MLPPNMIARLIEQRDRVRADARKLAQQVASVEGSHQQEALKFLAGLDAAAAVGMAPALPRFQAGRPRFRCRGLRLWARRCAVRP